MSASDNTFASLRARIADLEEEAAQWAEAREEEKDRRIAELEAVLADKWNKEGEGVCPLCNIIQHDADVKRIALEKRIAELEEWSEAAVTEIAQMAIEGGQLKRRIAELEAALEHCRAIAMLSSLPGALKDIAEVVDKALDKSE